MVSRAWRDEQQGDDGIEAAVMPRTGRVVVMSSVGNEVISPEKAAAIFDAVTLRRQQLAAAAAPAGEAGPA
jgi:hypothetical protein